MGTYSNKHRLQSGIQIKTSSETTLSDYIPQKLIMSREILEKEAIEPCGGESGFFSPVFVILQKGRGWRPRINPKDLNQYLHTNHFKIESIYPLKRYFEKRGFYGQNRLEGCVFHNQHQSQPQEIPQVLVELYS